MPVEPSALRKRVLAALLVAPRPLSWLMKNMHPNDAKQMTNLMGNLRHAGYALIEANFWKLTHLGIEKATKSATANHGTTEGAATTVRGEPDEALPTGSAASGGAAPDPDDVLRRMLKTPPVTLADVARKHRSTPRFRARTDGANAPSFTPTDMHANDTTEAQESKPAPSDSGEQIPATGIGNGSQMSPVRDGDDTARGAAASPDPLAEKLARLAAFEEAEHLERLPPGVIMTEKQARERFGLTVRGSCDVRAKLLDAMEAAIVAMKADPDVQMAARVDDLLKLADKVIEIDEKANA